MTVFKIKLLCQLITSNLLVNVKELGTQDTFIDEFLPSIPFERRQMPSSVYFSVVLRIQESNFELVFRLCEKEGYQAQ
jgi:hypothetical protein